EMAKINAIAFDKTGTLTRGEPQLTHVIPYGSHSKEELLKVAVSVEDLSEHPLARAIVRDGKKQLKNTAIPEAANLKSITARGVSAEVYGKNIYIGNRRLMEEVTKAPIPNDLNKKLMAVEEGGH